MYLGTQFAARTDSDYETFKQLGVNNINGFPDVSHQNWTVENLVQYREKVEDRQLKTQETMGTSPARGVDSSKNKKDRIRFKQLCFK